MNMRNLYWLGSILLGALLLSGCLETPAPKKNNAPAYPYYQQRGVAGNRQTQAPGRTVAQANPVSSAPLPSKDGKRVALIIGNSNYTDPNVNVLPNPVNDAQDITSKLQGLGFIVIHKRDLNKQQMEEAFRSFSQQLRSAQLGLFFYAGHGVQFQGQNYLIPVNANPSNINANLSHGGESVAGEFVTADQVLMSMEQSGTLTKILILDACRDSAIFEGKKGLVVMQPQAGYGGGIFISYSTKPGTTASDGGGRNSPYAESLLHFIGEPNLPIEMLFKKVATEVKQKTMDSQIPWNHSSLVGGDLCLAGCFSSMPITTVTPGKAHCTNQVSRGLYQGECQNGLPHGQGVMKYPSGEYYQGQFSNGLRHGHGVQYLPDGTEIESNFCNGRVC